MKCVVQKPLTLRETILLEAYLPQCEQIQTHQFNI